MTLAKDLYRTGLHNSSSKDQIISTNLPRAAKVYFISMWRFRYCMEESLERQLLIRGQAQWRKHAARGPFIGHCCYRRI